MANDFKKILKKFDSEKNKSMLGIELMANLEIESNQIIDFVFLEEKFSVKLSEDDKFKLKNIYKNTVQREGDDILKSGMSPEEKAKVLMMLYRLDQEEKNLILLSMESFKNWLSNHFYKK